MPPPRRNMSAMVQIEPVPRAHWPAALELLAGKGRTGRPGAAFEAMLSGPQADRCSFWWARARRGAQAAAITLRNPGRTAMIYHSPAAGADPAALSQLLEALTDATLADNIAFVQAMLPPQARADADALLRAGFLHLARLIYLRRNLSDVAHAPPPAEGDPASALAWPTLARGDDQRLGQVIADTYVDSHDCPVLLGLRPMEDVIASHRASGIFRPQWWWMPTVGGEGECIGCVLVNADGEGEGVADVVYLGVRPAWRRRGFARAMIRRAARVTARESARAMHLAVDATNTAAVRLYRQEGFREVHRKDAYIKHSRPPQRPQ